MLKIPNSNDTRDVAENLNDALLTAAAEDNINEIIDKYNSEQARRVVELEEEICKLRYEIALREAAIKFLDPEYTPPVPLFPIGAPYENSSQIIQPL